MAMPMLVLTISGDRCPVEVERLAHHVQQSLGDQLRSDRR